MSDKNLLPFILVGIVDLSIWWISGIIIAVFSCWVFHGEFSFVNATVWWVTLSAASAIVRK